MGLTYFAIVSTYVPFIIRAVRDNGSARQTASAGTATTGDSAVVTAGVDSSGAPTATLTADDSSSSGSAVAVPAAKPRRKPTLGTFLLGMGALLLIAAAAPFLAGLSNIIGLLIIGFALMQAWRMNKRVPIDISGPYQVGAKPA